MEIMSPLEVEPLVELGRAALGGSVEHLGLAEDAGGARGVGGQRDVIRRCGSLVRPSMLQLSIVRGATPPTSSESDNPFNSTTHHNPGAGAPDHLGAFSGGAGGWCSS